MHTLCCEAASEYKTGAVGVYACLAALERPVVDASSFRPSPSSPSQRFPPESHSESKAL